MNSTEMTYYNGITDCLIRIFQLKTKFGRDDQTILVPEDYSYLVSTISEHYKQCKIVFVPESLSCAHCGIIHSIHDIDCPKCNKPSKFNFDF